MTPGQALEAIGHHFDEGQLKHPEIRSTGDAIGLLTDRLSKVVTAEGSTGDHDRDQQLARRILQLAGACVRIVVNLDLHETVTADPIQQTTSPPESTA